MGMECHGNIFYLKKKKKEVYFFESVGTLVHRHTHNHFEKLYMKRKESEKNNCALGLICTPTSPYLGKT